MFPRSLKIIFLVKILEFFDSETGSGMEKFGSGIRDGKNSDPGSGINISDPQHCRQDPILKLDVKVVQFYPAVWYVLSA
jgi:hypothetical protein